MFIGDHGDKLVGVPEDALKPIADRGLIGQRGRHFM